MRRPALTAQRPAVRRALVRGVLLRCNTARRPPHHSPPRSSVPPHARTPYPVPRATPHVYFQRMPTSRSSADQARIGVIMGSRSDLKYMQPAIDLLGELGVPFEARVVSAHRTPDWMFEYASTAESRGLHVIIAAAGGAAHLPGMVAAKTVLPVLGVPMPATALTGLDSLLSIVQMPKGIPVGTLAIGEPGAVNAALLAASIVGNADPAIRDRVRAWRKKRTDEVLADTEIPTNR